MKKSDTVIVTGAHGLVGSAVVDHLRAHQFTCVVGLERRDCDLIDPGSVIALFNRVCPKHVFHAAATVYGLAGNMANQGKSYFDNTMINTNVIDASHKVGVEKITVMGTNAVYPWPPRLPYLEDTIFDGRPHAAESAYGHAKRGMLAMLEAYKASYGMDFAYLVSGNLYGPRDKFDPINGHVLPSLVYKFYQATQTGGDVEVWGDGSATRDFLYSADLAEVARLVMMDCTSGPINVGSGKSSSIREIVDLLCKLSSISASRIIWLRDMPVGRPDCYADLSELSALGFSPAYTIDRGLRETWDWFVRYNEEPGR